MNKNFETKVVLACSLGECVHVAGVNNFLGIARQIGYKTTFLGPAIAIEDLIAAIQLNKPDVVGVSYRLSPETSKSLLCELQEELEKVGLTDRFLLLFGATPPVAAIAKDLGMFDAIFSSDSSTERLIAVLKGEQWTGHFRKVIRDFL